MENRLKEILKIALDYNVTDIHFSLFERAKETVVIEMRVNGKIYQLKPHQDDNKLFHYLMYRANLDLSSIYLPQTGSFEQEVCQQHLALRFAIISSYHYTNGVLRILNNHALLKTTDLSNDEDVKKYLGSITGHRTGLFIFSGPTGSGKTTSLYTILNECEGKKIFTLEDPVEVVNEHYIQLQVNEKQHMSYADGIKQLMRHDPDIIMIGEIRDQEAAEMAVRSALTGHLVVTSLHASSCISAIYRMLELGVSQFQLQDVLCGVSNQRLFDCAKGGKTGIYEFMNREEVNYWFANKTTSKEFVSLRERILRAIQNQEIDSSEAKADLLM